MTIAGLSVPPETAYAIAAEMFERDSFAWVMACECGMACAQTAPCKCCTHRRKVHGDRNGRAHRRLCSRADFMAALDAAEVVA